MRTALRVFSMLPYAAFLYVVLAPVAALFYALAAIVRAGYEGLRAGWREHSPPK